MSLSGRKLTEQEFFRQVIERFPEVKPEIMSEEGLPHLQMMEFAIYAKALYDKGSKEKLIQVIAFVEDRISIADSKLYNTIGVSFVESLMIRLDEAKRTEVAKLLPKQMASMYESLSYMFEKKGMNWPLVAVAISMFLVGFILALFSLGTLLILIGGGPSMSQEANGYFNVFLLGDFIFGLSFLILFKAHKRMKGNQASHYCLPNERVKS